MRVRGSFAVLLAAGLFLPVLHAAPARAVSSVVSLEADSATMDANQFVDDQHQVDSEGSGDDFLTFGEHRAPKPSKAIEGTSTAFISQASTLETPAEPPFPLSPLNDIAMAGTSTSNATATGNGPAVPVTFSDGSFEASFTTTAAVPVFFSGAIHTTNTDAKHSCSSVTVDFTGPGTFARHFAAYTGGDCPKAKPHQQAWAESFTLPTAAEYEIDVEYDSEVDDDVTSGDASSTSASATASLNMAFFPPTAKFAQTISGFTGSFDGTGSSPNTPSAKLAKWVWTFGDGKTATTTKPKVTHTYPTSPAKAPIYTVTLQVVDAGGAVSPPVSHTVDGTAVSLHVKTKAALTASGAVTPNRRGGPVIVALSRKKHGKFHTAATFRASLTSHSRYSAEFEGPPSGTCRFVVTYPGDKTHLASKRTKTFRC